MRIEIKTNISDCDQVPEIYNEVMNYFSNIGFERLLEFGNKHSFTMEIVGYNDFYKAVAFIDIKGQNISIEVR